jgi:pyrimidine-nucleoside phosphorylase
MITAEILRKKRIGQELSIEEIRHLVDGMKTGEVSDVQITAFLTSTCIHGLTSKETGALTFAMRDSGDKFDFSSTNRPKIDKHSTGGVGDKLSLLLVPLVVPCGLAVPMISGRGLGHTGGTLDKLDSIVGFNVRLEESDFYKLMQENFCFMASQTEDLVPADKKMYHIRDITGNVDSIGLITASILSKKLVEDLDGLVLDMKVGNGAFMRDFDSARELAESMAGVAREVGLKMRILFTSMEQPLGRKIGNWLEVEETIDALSGNCPEDIRIITEKLASSMLLLGNIAENEADALKKIRDAWESGVALNFFRKIVSAQGGDLNISYEKYKNPPRLDITSNETGRITKIDTLGLGLGGILLGAGRKKAEDSLDYGAGIILHKKLGDEVTSGEPIATIFANDSKKLDEASKSIKNCFYLGKEEIQIQNLILDEWSV